MSVKRLDWPPNASPSGDGARVSAFVKIRLEDISFRDLEIRLRHTVAQRLADEGMREELLQQFLGHEAPETTQRYYEPRRTDVKEAFEEERGNVAMIP